MKVSELILWLQTQDQEATVQVMVHEAHRYCDDFWDSYEFIEFDPYMSGCVEYDKKKKLLTLGG